MSKNKYRNKKIKLLKIYYLFLSLLKVIYNKKTDLDLFKNKLRKKKYLYTFF